MSINHPAPPPLPPSRDFMTSLFNSLTSPDSSPPTQTSNPNPESNSTLHSASIPTPQRVSKENERDSGSQNQNSLKQIDAQKKALLMTLHVIFPPPLLLHALDLLDRGGVGRVVLREEADVGGRAGTGGGLEDRKDGEGRGMGKKSSDARAEELESSGNAGVENAGVGEPGIDTHKPKISPSASPNANLPPLHLSPDTSPPKTKQTPLYQVRSSQPSKWHSSRSAFGAGAAHEATENTYTVHLDAWNCSCAAFTFSAFPASSSFYYPSISTSTSPTSYFPWDFELPPDEEHLTPEKRKRENEGEKKEEEKWRYGGWTKTSQVPICKHLLACLLVERWGDVLGTYVRERVVGREEMGGLAV